MVMGRHSHTILAGEQILVGLVDHVLSELLDLLAVVGHAAGGHGIGDRLGGAAKNVLHDVRLFRLLLPVRAM